jgi:sortase (surface protein transpeptidase)
VHLGILNSDMTLTTCYSFPENAKRRTVNGEQ